MKPGLARVAKTAVAISSIIILSACQQLTDILGSLADKGAGPGDGADDPLPFNADYLPYYPGSIFVFERTSEDLIEHTTTTGYRIWKPETFSAESGSMMLLDSAQWGTEETSRSWPQFRKVKGVIEASWYGTRERCFDSVSPGSGGIGFAMASGISKPSSMFGSMIYSAGNTGITTKAGAFPSAIYVRSEYMPDGTNDPYLYDVGAEETWDREVGIVRCQHWYVDWSMGYPNYISMRITDSLAWCEIHYPDGRVRTWGTVVGFDRAPEAPAGLIVLREGSPKLFWKDHSIFEEAFVFERREGDAGSFIEIGTTEANDDIWYDASADSAKNYTYRVKARNRSGDSSPSNEAGLSAVGSPSAPTYAGWYFNSSLQVGILASCWAQPAPTVFIYYMNVGGAWTEIARANASDGYLTFEGNFLNLQKDFYWNGSAASTSSAGATAWPSGAVLGVRTANAIGNSPILEATFTP